MIYELKHFDQVLLRFSAENGADPNVKILWVDKKHQKLLPLDLKSADEEGIESWVRHRSIPKNRAYVDTVLSSMGLSINRPFEIMRLSKGLSLNDCYWITEEGFTGTFEKYNLYQNRFNRILGEIAFTGYGSDPHRITSSPEFTTNGILPKCWRRERGVVRLYKGATAGASNTGNEPYSEYYAYQIAKVMGIDAVEYGITVWKDTLCSTCRLFTDIDHSYVPVGRIVRSGGMKAVREYYQNLGKKYAEALNDMIVFDALILNTDRHFGNFGFMVDSKTNRITGTAPLFDHGNSLLSLAGVDSLKDEKSIKRYADQLLPCVYDSFIDEAKPLLTHKNKEGLRKLLDFHFKKHRMYNLPDERLKLVEYVVQEQARKLLD